LLQKISELNVGNQLQKHEKHIGVGNEVYRL